MNMLYVYIFLVAFTLVATFGAFVYSWRIMRIHATPTFTWVLITAAMGIRLIQLIWGTFYVREVLDFYQQLDPWTIFFSQGLAIIPPLCFFIAFGRIYYGLRGLLK